MGSTGRSSGYSDVENRTTNISAEDIAQITKHGYATGYFQTWNAFDINQALRISANEGIPLEEAITRVEGNSWDTPELRADTLKTIQTMDANMQRTNADMNVVRMADHNYLASIMTKTGVPEDVQTRLLDAAGGWAKFRESDVQILRDHIVNNTIHENAFMSTTYNTTLSDSAFSGRSIKLDMNVTRGTKGMFSPTGRESEFVIDRHVGYDVSDITISADGTQLVFKTKT